MGDVRELKGFTHGQTDAALMKIGQDVGMGTAEGITAFLAGELVVGRKSPPSYKMPKPYDVYFDLGILTVPEDYVHTNSFKTAYGNPRKLTEVSFPNPTRIMKSGEMFHVRVFRQYVCRSTSSEERLAFLATMKAVHTGVQGLFLLFELMWSKIPNGFRCVSFDEKNRLFIDTAGNYMVPVMDRRPHTGVRSKDDLELFLSGYEFEWRDPELFICFTELTEEEKIILGIAVD